MSALCFKGTSDRYIRSGSCNIPNQVVLVDTCDALNHQMQQECASVSCVVSKK